MDIEHHLALPEGPGPHPAVIVVHEMLGLNADIRRIADRFAENGYAALAPHMWSGGNPLVCLTKGLTNQGWVLDRLDTCREFLAGQPSVDGARIGVVGFCWGGGFALLFGRRPGVRAAAVNYGAVPKKAVDLSGVCPVVASYGARDMVFGDHGERLEQHLSELGIPHDVKSYDTGHSFLSQYDVPAWILRIPNPMRVGYSEPAAEDTWRRMLDWFGRYVRDGETAAS